MGGKTGIRSPKRQRVADMLDATPEGMHTAAIARAIGDQRDAVLKMLSTMAERGFIRSVREFVGSTRNTQTRWYLAKHKDAAMAASRAAGIVDEPEAINIVPPRSPVVVTEAPRVIDSSQCRPWAVAATGVV